MSSWKGLDGQWAAEGMPHVTKIQRKPEGVGAEMKAMACGESGVLMSLDIMEGKLLNQMKPFEFYGAGTAVVLRLCQPYFGTDRVIIADSAFSSVKTTMAAQKYGLHFMGAVKTAHKLFPKQFLNKWFSDGFDQQGKFIRSRGSHCLLSSQFQKNVPNQMDMPGIPIVPVFGTMYAIGWQDKKLKAIVSSCGTTMPSPSPSIRSRHKKMVVDGSYVTEHRTINIPRPVMVEQFFRHFAAIDIHDHYRQGVLEMERTWHTKTWWHRIFATVWSITIVNTYFGYRLDYKRDHDNSDDGMDSFHDFLGKLAHQLIFNPFIPEEARGLRAPDADAEVT